MVFFFTPYSHIVKHTTQWLIILGIGRVDEGIVSQHDCIMGHLGFVLIEKLYMQFFYKEVYFHGIPVHVNKVFV